MSLDEDQELIQAFFKEAEATLKEIHALTATLRIKPQDSAALNDLFRKVHTIKGNASFLGLPNLTELAAVYEQLLDQARKNLVKVDNVFLQTIARAQRDIDELVGKQKKNLDVAEAIRELKKLIK